MNSSISMPSVRVLGTGIISALGADGDATRSALYRPNPVLPGPVRGFSTALDLPVFAAPAPPSAAPGTPPGRAMLLLYAALGEALDRAGIDRCGGLAGLRVGVCVGTTVACQLNDVPFYAALRAGKRPAPAPFRNYVGGNPAERIRRDFGLNGPALTVSTACASGADAVGVAASWLRVGLCDLAIAGGTDELNKVPFDGFHALGVCSHRPCRPFDAARDGLNLGEGAGVLILARADSPRARDARFEVSGFGKTADARHITQPDPEGVGLERAIRIALADAGGLDPARIAFVNAHGTGTAANDKTESGALARVFGPSVKFMSTKGLTGHTLGAAGTIECILSMIMLDRELAVRSVRFETADGDLPCAPLRVDTPVPGAEFALSTSLAFGGSNSALVIRRRIA